MSVAEKICRTCGKTFDGSNLCPLYDSMKYENEIKMALEEFEIWNLNISQNDGLPQKICLTCFDSFCQIHNFRLMCIEAQMMFGEMCTGLDIIINNDITDEDDFFLQNFDCEQSVIVKERYTFPGDKLLKTSTPANKSNVFDSSEVIEELGQCPDNIENKPEENLLELKQHRCEFCMLFMSFDEPDELNRHYNAMHSSNLPYPCPKCDMCFDRKAKRNSHARCHFDATPLECEHCGKRFRGDQMMMAQHIAYYHDSKNRECSICQLKFENISLKKYYYHMRWHNDSKLLKCRFCDKKFIQSPHLQCHEKTHTGETKFICKECGFGCTNSVLLKKHILLHERKEIVECPKCPKRYFTRVGIKLHNKKTHDPDKKPPHCDVCDQTFIYEHDLVIHNHRKHGAPAPKIVKRTKRPISAASAALRIIKKHKKREFIKPYNCDKCEEAYVLEIQLIRHLKVHEEYRPHQCKFCSKNFKRDSHLKLHVNNIHFNRKPHKCSICGAAFAQRSHLNDHIAIRHENKRDYECKICQKKFGTSQLLKMHIVIHSTDRPYICKVCDKSFKQLMSLKSHMTRIHLWKTESASENKGKNEKAQDNEDEQEMSE